MQKPSKLAQIPQIRFAGFTEDWKRRKLIDYLDVSRNKNKEEIFGKEDVLSVSGDYGIVNQIEFQGRSFAGVSVVNYGVVDSGDVVYTKSPLKLNPYGIIKTNKGKPGIVSTLYAVYKPKDNVYSEFIQIYFEQDARMNNYMHPLVNKGAKNDMKVSDENALQGEVCFPEREEQEKISTYFQSLDNLITLHQSKFEKLQKVKKSCLQNLFPQNNQNTPKIRFKNFTDEWVERKADEICTIETGKSNTQDQNDNGKYPFYIRSDKPVRSNKFLYDCEAVITIGDGSIGKVFHYVKGKFDLHQRCYKMTDFKDVTGKYFYYYFSTKFYDRAMKMTAKATVDSVRLEMISDMFFSIPNNLAEQRKISDFFSKLDKLITLQQRKVEKLKNIKKALLNKMFI